jgi:hypothetical protein
MLGSVLAGAKRPSEAAARGRVSIDGFSDVRKLLAIGISAAREQPSQLGRAREFERVGRCPGA